MKWMDDKKIALLGVFWILTVLAAGAAVRQADLNEGVATAAFTLMAGALGYAFGKSSSTKDE